MYSPNGEPIVCTLVCQLAIHQGRITHSRPAVAFIRPHQYSGLIQTLVNDELQTLNHLHHLHGSVNNLREAIAETFITTFGWIGPQQAGYLCFPNNSSWYSPPLVHYSGQLV